jgi:HlyD family secretion protein
MMTRRQRAGGDMDRPIEKKTWTPRRTALAASLAVGAIALIYLVATSGTTRLNIEGTRLSTAQVRQGEFQEYVPVNGTVQPMTTVYLDLEEGGIVEKIYVEGGNPIKKGELILSFSNTTAQKQNIETETRLLENLNQLRNTKISLTQSNLILKDQLLDLNHRIDEQEKVFERFERLMKAPNSQISKEQFETASDLLTYYKDKRTLLEERIKQEKILEVQQSVQIESSIKRIDRNLDILSKIIDSLEVRAPIDGHLSTLSAEIGQSFQRGQRIGQIDQLDQFKVRADVDQYYISKVATGQRGTFEFGGREYHLQVTKIYPEVTEGLFQVDMTFGDQVPEGIKRGQTLRIDLSLSESKRTNVVAKGGFYKHTNGRWAYRVSEDGLSARRVSIVLGRQNPQSVEVLEGLNVGDWILTSSYESFGDVDELTFPEPVTR